MTNDLVNSNDGCMDLVKEALRFIDCKNTHHYTLTPRKSLEIPVMVVCMKDDEQKDSILCYYPREDKWSMFQGPVLSKINMVTSCRGKLYFVSQEDRRILQYDLYFNCWKLLPFEEQWRFRKLFVRNEEIYAVVSETRPCPECESDSLHWPIHPPFRTLSIIMKKPESNSWDCVSSFDEDSREGMCVVCSDNFIYFIGGTALNDTPKRILADADRYDLISNTWDKIGDIQEPRYDAHGAAGQGKIFIAGGYNGNIHLESCEVFHEATNEWQFIATLKKPFLSRATLLCAEGKLYLFNSFLYRWKSDEGGILDCYDPDRNEWEEKTPIPIEMIRAKRIAIRYGFTCGLVKVNKECLDPFQNATTDEDSRRERGKEKRKCIVM